MYRYKQLMDGLTCGDERVLESIFHYSILTAGSFSHGNIEPSYFIIHIVTSV